MFDNLIKFFFKRMLVSDSAASAYFDELISKNELIETPSYKY